MKKTLLLFLWLFTAGWGNGQSLSPEVIATAGDHFTSANAQLSWTIGETVTETFAAGSSQITQGFHQTNLTIVAVNDPMADFQVRVYPNPTVAWVNIESQVSTPAFSVEISDAQGRALLFQSAAPQGLLRSLDLSGYAAGVYYLRLRTEGQETTQTFKILKHN